MANNENIGNYVLNEVKFWRGTQTEYNNLANTNSIDRDTIYFVFGDEAISGNTIHLGDELMDDELYERLVGGGGGGLTAEAVQKLIDASTLPLRIDIDALSVDVDNINSTIINTVRQIVEEEFSGTIESVVNTVAGPIVDAKVDTVLGDIMADLEYTKNKVDSIDNFSTVYTPTIVTTNRIFNPVNSQFSTSSIYNVEIGLHVYSDIKWNLDKNGLFTMPTKVTSSEIEWNNTPIGSIPLNPEYSSEISKIYTYETPIKSVDVSFEGMERGYKVENNRIKYVENAITTKSSANTPTWGNRWFKGVVTSKEITESSIKSASSGIIVPNNKSALKTLNTGSITGVAKNEFYFIAYPEYAGELTSIFLNGVQDILGAFEIKKVSMVNAYGISQIYNVYVTVFSGSIADGTVLTTK